MYNNHDFTLYGGEMKHSKLCAICLVLFAVIIGTDSYTDACDVAVVSGRVTTNGRPVIWKNRDCSADWHQEIKYFDAVNSNAGGYLLVYNFDDIAEYNNGTPVNPSGGINKSGFAVSCTSVYEDFNQIHEAYNINTDLIRQSTQECRTIDEFEDILLKWKDEKPDKVISGNFVVIDAYGGACLYEVYTGMNLALVPTIMFTRCDANTGEIVEYRNGAYTVLVPGTGDEFIGFFNQANNNRYSTLILEDINLTFYGISLGLADGSTLFLNLFVEYILGGILDMGTPDTISGNGVTIPINYGEERKERATEVLTQLASEGRLNYRTVLKEVSEDVIGDQSNHSTSSEENYSTTYCISRNQTRLGMVVDGVKAGDDPALSVFWCALGEPSIAVFAPYFAHAESTHYYSWVDGIGIDGKLWNLNATSMLTRISNRREAYDNLIYDSNTGTAMSGMDTRLMNKLELYKAQTWITPLEDFVLDKADAYLDKMRAGNIDVTAENLKIFSDYCVEYIYKNYNEASTSFFQWQFVEP